MNRINDIVDGGVFQVAFLPDGRPCPLVLTAAEVIELLRLGPGSKRTLKFYRDEGRLKGIRLGRKMRYRLVDVEEFLEQKAGQNGE